MRIYLIVCLLLCGLGGIQAQNHQNLSLLAHWNDPNLRKVDGDQVWSDIMGWKDTVKNKEYVIAGSTDSIYFFDITDPTHFIKCDVEEGHSRNAVNRDYEVYSHYVYCVSDRSSPLGALQIFDMQYLPDSVHKVYDSDSLSISSHTLFIEASRKRLYLCATMPKPSGFWSMGVLSLEDPEHPKFLGELDETLGCDYTHEVFVKNDTAYCSCGNQGLFIYDLRDMSHQVLISSITNYPQNGYNHSSWLDSTGKYLMFTDENHGLGIKIFDMHDIRNPDFLTVWNSNTGALPHNAYWNGRWGVTSSYEDGVYIYDLKNIESFSPFQKPATAAFYDTYPLNAEGVYSTTGYHGCWGVWPFLPSGNIIASDISEGLFVLKPGPTMVTEETRNSLVYTRLYPNPARGEVSLVIHSRTQEHATIRVTDIHGREVIHDGCDLRSGANTIPLATAGLESGIYLVTIHVGQDILKQKLIKQ